MGRTQRQPQHAGHNQSPRPGNNREKQHQTEPDDRHVPGNGFAATQRQQHAEDHNPHAKPPRKIAERNAVVPARLLPLPEMHRAAATGSSTRSIAVKPAAPASACLTGDHSNRRNRPSRYPASTAHAQIITSGTRNTRGANASVYAYSPNGTPVQTPATSAAKPASPAPSSAARYRQVEYHTANPPARTMNTGPAHRMCAGGSPRNA